MLGAKRQRRVRRWDPYSTDESWRGMVRSMPGRQSFFFFFRPSYIHRYVYVYVNIRAYLYIHVCLKNRYGQLWIFQNIWQTHHYMGCTSKIAGSSGCSSNNLPRDVRNQHHSHRLPHSTKNYRSIRCQPRTTGSCTQRICADHWEKQPVYGAICIFRTAFGPVLPVSNQDHSSFNQLSTLCQSFSNLTLRVFMIFRFRYFLRRL